MSITSALTSPPMPDTRRPDLRNSSAESVLRAASRTGSPVRMARAAMVPPNAPMPTISIRILEPPRSLRWGPPCAASGLDNEVDLDAGPKRQRGGPDRRAGGKGLTEILCIDAIHRGEVSHVREKHTGAHDVIETLAGRFENRREVLEDALRLCHNAPLDHLASGRVLADLTAEEEETIDFDRLGKWADRRREFTRGNCGLAHGKLLWIPGYYRLQ